MANNDFRHFRRDPPLRNNSAEPRAGMSDPLAELARLIGQSDPRGAFGRGDDNPAEAYPAEAYEETEPAAALDWTADEDYAGGDEAADDYAPEPENSYQPYRSEPGTWPRGHHHDEARHHEARHDEVPPAQRQYSPPLFGEAHNDLPDEGQEGDQQEDPRYGDEPAADARARRLPFPRPMREPEAAGPFDRRGQAPAEDGHYDEEDNDYSDEEYDEYDEGPAPARRSRAVTVLSVLGLIILGSAGAFGYRTMFGSAGLPGLPPIIRPSSTPVKIVPSHDAQASAPSQVATTGSAGDHLVSHEEKPVDVQADAPAAGGVTTIPVISNTPPDGMLPGTQPLSGSMPPATAPVAEPQVQALAAPVPPAPEQGALPLSSGARPVHTVTIRAGQSAADNSSPVEPRPAERLVRERPTRATRDETETASAGPLSIVPGQENGQENGAAPRLRTRTAMARSEEPTALTSRSEPALTGGYAVQVSSRRSEADAQASLRALQAKYPQQLGSQHGMIRRADLGAKGVYYRALVGPFASAEEASRLCSSLKAAGGSCIVQRN